MLCMAPVSFSRTTPMAVRNGGQIMRTIIMSLGARDQSLLRLRLKRQRTSVFIGARYASALCRLIPLVRER